MEGDLVLTAGGDPFMGLYKVMAAGGYNGPCTYSYSNMGFGAVGDFVWVGGPSGNLHVATLFGNGDFNPAGSLVLNQNQSLYSGPESQGAQIIMGGEGQSFPLHKIASFRYDADTAAGLVVENPNSGSNAFASIMVVGEPTTSPAEHARYIGMTVVPKNYSANGGSICPPNVGLLQTGGNLAGGMLLYADSGPIELRTDIRANSLPDIHINKLSDDQNSEIDKAGYIGLNNDNPNARLDINGDMILREMVEPENLENGHFINNGTDIIVKIGGQRMKIVLTPCCPC